MHQTKVISGLVKPQAGVIQGDKQSNGNGMRERRKKYWDKHSVVSKRKAVRKECEETTKEESKPGHTHTHTHSNRGNREELQLRGG